MIDIGDLRGPPLARPNAALDILIHHAGRRFLGRDLRTLMGGLAIIQRTLETNHALVHPTVPPVGG